jgi:hypothetical protein
LVGSETIEGTGTGHDAARRVSDAMMVARPFKAGNNIGRLRGASRSDAVSSQPQKAGNKRDNPMANTLTSLHFHLVVSTQNRHPWLEKHGMEYDERYL